MSDFTPVVARFPYLSTHWQAIGFKSEADLKMALFLMGTINENYVMGKTDKGKQTLCFNQQIARKLMIFSILKENGDRNSCENKEPVEKRVVSALVEKIGGLTEVETPAGNIDILTKSEIIEVKVGFDWKHGLGQLLAYAQYYPHHIKRLHLFGISRLRVDVVDICEKLGVNVTLDKKF